MNEQLFVERREPDWKRLNLLSAKADSSPTNLTSDELEEFVRLYKRVSADLAKVRTQSANVELIEFLNDLCGRAYGTIYRAPRPNIVRAIGNGVLRAAQTARRRSGALILSAGLFLFAAAFAYVALDHAPESRDYLVPEGWQEQFKHWKEGVMEERSAGESMAMTGFYMGNNPRAAIATGAIAASTFGVGSAALVFMNGTVMGALLHEVAPAGRVGYVFIRIMPHGVTELSGLIFAGASGFVMGAALLRPGRRTRGEALRVAGKDALTLLTIAIVMMFLAAPIEGFFSFNPSVPDWLKIVFASGSALGWAAFWYGYGRNVDSAA